MSKQPTPKNTASKRRLGRGLSSLLNQPVAVDIPDESETQSTKGHKSLSDSRLHEKNARSDASSPPHLPHTDATGSGEVDKHPASQPAQSPTTAGTQADTPSSGGSGGLVTLKLSAIRANPFQPRTAFDDDALARLADSIRSAGVMQPVLVRPAGDHYQLIAGERRVRAATIAGLTAVPAIVTDISDQQAAEHALIENIQRAELNPIERAQGLRSLIDTFSLTHEQAAQRLGMTRPSVSNLVRLTELPDQVQAMLADNTLTLGHAKVLLSITDHDTLLTLAQRTIDQHLSVRALEQLISDTPVPTQQTNTSASAPNTQLDDLEQQLSEHLATKVRIKANAAGTKGRLVLNFYSLDHFDDLMERLRFRSS